MYQVYCKRIVPISSLLQRSHYNITPIMIITSRSNSGPHPGADAEHEDADQQVAAHGAEELEVAHAVAQVALDGVGQEAGEGPDDTGGWAGVPVEKQIARRQ